MRTCGEATRTLLIASGLPCYLWAEAMAHACWIQNRTPTRALDGKTLYEMMTGRKPNLTGIQCFGAAAYIKLKNAGKLDKRASKGHFVGYDNESKGYQIYWPEKHVVSVEHNVIFNPGDLFKEPVEIMNKEEQNKVLQNPTEKTSEIPVENPSNQNSNENQNKNSLPEDPAPSNIPTALEHSIEDSTPIVEPLCHSHLRDTLPEPEPNTGCSFQARKAPGAY